MRIKKALIFDSGAIITLALTDLLYILEPLKWAFGGEFFIPEAVKTEAIDVPLKMKKFALEALRIKTLISKKILRVVSSSELKKETFKLLRIANTTYKAGNEFIKIIHEGEAACLALYRLLDAKKKAVVIDERTTRMLCEAPENLRELLENKLHTRIEAMRDNFNFFTPIKIIRTAELCLIAYKKRIITLPALPPEAIEALLYALKYKGCAISSSEIRIAKRM